MFRRIELISSNVSSYNSNVIKLRDNIEIHTDERSVIKDNSVVDLTNKEYDLLLYLAQNKGRILSRSQILDSVWGIDFVCDTRTVDIHVQRVRKKLDENKNNSIIETAFGIGYKLVN
ncbi:Sensory transduction protein regX3 [compost metagenome]